MENCIWQGKLFTAYDVAQEYELEKNIRAVSSKELLCPDKDCESPTLCYRSGDKRKAHFAHRSIAKCDYAKFDSENPNFIRNISKSLYEHFKNLSYNVKTESKLLAHHYTHIVFERENHKPIAVEITTNKILEQQVLNLVEEYQKEGIPVKWLIVDDITNSLQENNTYFIKRYLLNESRNNDFIVISKDGKYVAQYRFDTKAYKYKNKEMSLGIGYGKIYREESNLKNLIIENEEITIKGFSNRFEEWLAQKAEKLSEIITGKEDRDERLNALTKKRNERYNPSPSHSIYVHSEIVFDTFEKISTEESENPFLNEDYEKRKEKILPYINQQDTPVWDSEDKRWVKCEICGIVDTSDKFSSYGGVNHANLGICENCKTSK